MVTNFVQKRKHCIPIYIFTHPTNPLRPDMHRKPPIKNNKHSLPDHKPPSLIQSLKCTVSDFIRRSLWYDVQ